VIRGGIVLKALLQFDRLYILGAEILKIQVTSLTDVSPDKMLISGIGSGFLHDLADISSLKDGQLLTVTEGDASAIPQQWTESAAEAPTAKTVVIYTYIYAHAQVVKKESSF
jgi:hypothetical protein